MVVLFLLLAAVSGVGFWAGRTALISPADPLVNEDEPISYVVDVGSVGRSLPFTADAEWRLFPAGRHSGTGVVTSVTVSPGDIVWPGDVAYSVGLRPVVIGEGDVPMFRSLGSDDEGADVAQFQNLMATLGFYGGEVSGRFDSATEDAAREWQESLGVESTGDVEMGDIVFIAPLPARVVLSDEVVAGSRLSDGEVVMSTLSPHPEFTISLSHEQADLVPLSADVLVSYPEGVWKARIDRAVETDLGQLDLVLSESSGGSICGGACFDWVDLRSTTSFRAEVVLIPETTGPLVPIAAITTDAVNNPSVTLTDGTLVPVRIIASANGIAVVEGIEPGNEISLVVDE